MKNLKLYLDTSVISHLYAEDTPDKMAETNRFWEACVDNKFRVMISPVTVMEIHQCFEPKRSGMLKKLREIQLEIAKESEEVTELADEYIKNGVLRKKSYDDDQ